MPAFFFLLLLALELLEAAGVGVGVGVGVEVGSLAARASFSSCNTCNNGNTHH